MSDWTDGYVSEIGYTFGYYSELNPLRIAVPFLNVGLTPPAIATACELGFGQGISVNIHAAASDVRWYGTDFNPAHAAFAQSLAEAAGSGAQLFDQSFAEFCARADLPDFDYIALHGVLSWVSEENQRVIVDFVRRKLKVGGVLYISYNCQPGHAAMVPLRHLLTEHAGMMAAPGRGIVARIDAALDFAEQLLALNPGFAVANPTIADRLKTHQGARPALPGARVFQPRLARHPVRRHGGKPRAGKAHLCLLRQLSGPHRCAEHDGGSAPVPRRDPGPDVPPVGARFHREPAIPPRLLGQGRAAPVIARTDRGAQAPQGHAC